MTYPLSREGHFRVGNGGDFGQDVGGSDLSCLCAVQGERNDCLCEGLHFSHLSGKQAIHKQQQHYYRYYY